MRTNKVKTMLFGIAAATMLVCGSVNAHERFRDVSVTIAADKAEYVPGEAVEIEIRLTNDGTAGRAIGNEAPRIFLAYGDGPFRRYVGPGESVVDPFSRAETDTAPAECAVFRSTVLYHRKKPTAHLSELYARPVRDTELEDFFALNQPGTYRIKAAFYDQTGKAEIESAAIEVSVSEPRDSDALVWESIKNDRDAALFLHTGGSSAAGASEFVEKMQRLATLYPTSVHAVRFVDGRKPAGQ